ncbi:iron-sulfur flavoprotein [Lachnospiraceae bacterium KM106-2]|nr:iron-sulfur flavoprotein [Lachnospiraceae bacterium KM106-2]
MKIVVINGTEIKGCTYNIKEIFLEQLREKNEVTEFYLPKDCPYFCCGCKNCFLKGEEHCPHADHTIPIWNAMMDADLLVFAYPVYALRTTGQIKALLDHYCCHWMVHRPEKQMFKKRAVILTQSAGAPNGAAQKEVATSLNWWGISDVKKLGFQLMSSIIWDEIPQKKRERMEGKIRKMARKYEKPRVGKRSLKIKLFFGAARFLHQNGVKSAKTISLDDQHWLSNGWITR